MTRPITGTARIHNFDAAGDRDFYAVVERRGWSCYVAGTCTAYAPPRYERWLVRARNEQEARKTCQYHFFASRWRLLSQRLVTQPPPHGRGRAR